MHQTLHADTVNKSHEDIIWKFMQTTEPLDEGEVDDTIEMNMEESLEDALARAVDGCVRILGLPKPSIEQMGEALAAARAYRPPVAGEQAATKKEKTPRYYALLPEVNLEELLRETFSSPKLDADGSFFDTLMANKRIAGRPHVTLVHEKGLPNDQALWDRCVGLFRQAQPALFKLKLDTVVRDGRVMALPVSDLSVSGEEEDEEGTGAEFVARLPDELKGKLHITVGTANKDINPFEARALVERWRKGNKSVWSCELEDVWVKGRVKGLSS